MDETSKQQTKETRTPMPPCPGRRPMRFRTRARRQRQLVDGRRTASGPPPFQGHLPPDKTGLRTHAQGHRRRPLPGKWLCWATGSPDTRRQSAGCKDFGPAETPLLADRFGDPPHPEARRPAQHGEKRDQCPVQTGGRSVSIAATVGISYAGIMAGFIESCGACMRDRENCTVGTSR